MAIFLGPIFLGLLLSVPLGESHLFGLFNAGTSFNNAFNVDWADIVDIKEKLEFKWRWNPEHPGKLTLYNSTTNTGLVVDSRSGRVALEESKGDKAIIDTDNESVSVGTSSAKTDEGFESNLKELYDVAIEAMGTPEHPMAPADLTNFNTERRIIMALLKKICPGFVDLVIEKKDQIKKNIPAPIIEIMKMILAPIVYVLKQYLLIMFAPQLQAWYTFKLGIRAFINIFQWLIKLFGALSKGIEPLIKSGAKFALDAVMAARNGALALYEILKDIGSKINLMEIWKNILTVPEMLSKLIYGLGGMLSEGVTGLFGIFSKIYQFTFGQIGTLKKFVDSILDFIRGGRPTGQDIAEATDKLLEVAKQQRSAYNPKGEFRVFNIFLQSVKGKGNFEIKGIRIMKLVKIITETTATAKRTVLEIMNLLNPFAPMRSILAKLFVDTIASLNTTKGPIYLNQLFPNIQIPDPDLEGSFRNLAYDVIPPENIDLSVIDLSTTDMLRSIPVVKEIYREFDEAAQEYTNSTLESLLTDENVEELVEFTTTLVGIRK